MVITQEEVELKNREIYDDTSGPVWKLAIYNSVHDGNEFINLGGARVLDQIAGFVGLSSNQTVVELCAGRGAVCRYLAEHFGCKITGVEWNPKQADCARTQLKRMAQDTARLVQIVNADCLAWQPAEAVDLVLSVDSMMLLPSISAVFRHAYRMVKPGGNCVFVTIGAGDRIQDSTRQFAWEMDGMSSLHSRDEYIQSFLDAGFEKPVVTDMTPAAIQTSEQIDQALHANRDTILRLAGEQAFHGWVEVGQQYLNAFRRRELSYLFAAGSRKKE